MVFASAYRFTVLFSYTALDPSYTLAPTVGWTAIEMSAGIISACLPTLVPAFKLIGRSLGLGKLLSLNTSKDGSRPTKVTLGTGAGTAQRSERRRSIQRVEEGDFYRLSDDANISTDDDHAYDGKLRPDRHITRTVASSPNERSHGRRMSGDEIPLNSIHVTTAIKQERN